MAFFAAFLKLGWSWLTTGGFKSLTDIVSKYQDSKIEHERIMYHWAKAQLDAIVQVRVATSHFFEMRVLTFLIALPFVLHLWLIFIDTITTNTRWEIVGWNVAAFPSPINEWEGAILLSFFGISTAAVAGMALLNKAKSIFWPDR